MLSHCDPNSVDIERDRTEQMRCSLTWAFLHAKNNSSSPPPPIWPNILLYTISFSRHFFEQMQHHGGKEACLSIVHVVQAYLFNKFSIDLVFMHI